MAEAVSLRQLAKVIAEMNARTVKIEAGVRETDEHVQDVARLVEGVAGKVSLPSGVALGNTVQQIHESVKVIRNDVDGNPNT